MFKTFKEKYGKSTGYYKFILVSAVAMYIFPGYICGANLLIMLLAWLFTKNKVGNALKMLIANAIGAFFVTIVSTWITLQFNLSSSAAPYFSGVIAGSIGFAIVSKTASLILVDAPAPTKTDE